jgi:uncharacterized protein
MICSLVQAGQKVGITANSHKVVRNLVEAVAQAADKLGIRNLLCIQNVSENESAQGRLQFTTDNAALFSAVGNSCQVAGGTAWLWARPEAFKAVDVLFVDEASQMSLANIVAVSQAASRVVLLGDPQQLNQPTQGSHPEGTDVSALDHVLHGEQTIPSDRGLFIEETWRLHPAICAFPVSHEGNQSACPEEADAVRELVREIILDNGSTWTDRDGHSRPVTLKDILIIAPYNAQVFELRDRLPGARTGTVDQFQGQEAPIVIYSMTTSSHADAPRGMEFLYSLNRLNVATSRAKCVCVLAGRTGSPRTKCR